MIVIVDRSHVPSTTSRPVTANGALKVCVQYEVASAGMMKDPTEVVTLTSHAAVFRNEKLVPGSKPDKLLAVALETD
jgi:hypothetical protein